MPLANLSILCDELDYHFKNPELLHVALTHNSDEIAIAKDSHELNYQRLEFVGDAVLGLAVADALYQRFPDSNEGELTQWRANLVNRDFLADIAKTIGVPNCMQISISGDAHKLQNNNNVLSDIMEALLAAIYFDGGWASAQKSINHLFSQHINSVKEWAHNKDAKSELQEYLQARQLALPEYQIISQTGPSHKPIFVVMVKLVLFDIEDKTRSYSATGNGDTRKEAEKQAAIKAMSYLQSANINTKTKID